MALVFKAGLTIRDNRLLASGQKTWHFTFVSDSNMVAAE